MALVEVNVEESFPDVRWTDPLLSQARPRDVLMECERPKGIDGVGAECGRFLVGQSTFLPNLCLIEVNEESDRLPVILEGRQ